MTATAPNTQTVGQLLTLTCNVTTVRGIISQVDLLWSRDSMILIKRINMSLIMESSLLLLTDTYIISQLNTTDDGRGYQCEVVINSSPLVMATGSVTLDVIGILFDNLCYV